MTIAKSNSISLNKAEIAEMSEWRGSVDEKLFNLNESHKTLRVDVGELDKKMEIVQIKLENIAVKAGLWGAIGAVLGSGAISAFGVMLWYFITKAISD